MGFNILEKMQNWHTWEDTVKDSDLYLDYLSEKFHKHDHTFLDEVDDLKKVLARLEAEYDKVDEEVFPAREALDTAVEEITELYKMIDDWDKFENLLASETAFDDYQKSLIIIPKWKKQHSSRNIVIKCLGSETFEECFKVKCLGFQAIEECLKRKSVEVSEARSNVLLLEPRMQMIRTSVCRAEQLIRSIEIYTNAFQFRFRSSPFPTPWVRGNMGPSSSPPSKRVKHESFALSC